ncbi:LacI family DNA-binding transcriptional regulator [Pseudooctadecabacter jejudonensis]|uniref:Catabolite control protein A n=1 Tax=Pseudooctadecabacter jejudonensis TaxID=1391910 RepID=A0A1Y5RB67_9RHOB|nr:LacI family DNA-binding transcriptional regulator [Pseudooctadecabacter jejudonensis]SLN13031.1 Catabolite control protein A [Pseudooctadecabacter jejudonensis]
MDKRATSYDVARLAGVSQSAVSRVFSPNGSASKTTRERVLAAAHELGFVPNPIAKSLSLGRSRLAGLVVTQYAQQNYPLALKSAVDLMSETGDALLIQIVDPTDMGDAAIRQLLEKRVDMILCAASISREAAVHCTDAGVPLVMINRQSECAGVDAVCSPNDAIMHDVVDMLHASGARHCVFLGGGGNNWVSAERCRGFVEACTAKGLPEPIVLEDAFTYNGGQSAIRALGASVTNLDAVVAANDAMAIGAMDVLRLDFGLNIPDDIQVVGHDDTETGRFQSYQLTSVRQNMLGIFAKAIELAVSRRNEYRRPDAKITVKNELVERTTTARPTASARDRLAPGTEE